LRLPVRLVSCFVVSIVGGFHPWMAQGSVGPSGNPDPKDGVSKQMEATKTVVTTLTLRKPMKRRFCPECGALMTEEDTLRRNDTLFVWFKCSKGDCDGEWFSWNEAVT
jgi:hypothetical protein